MIAFIDDHREAHGVEPICKVLPIAPSTWLRPCGQAARSGQAVGTGRSGIWLSKVEVRRVFEENFRVYGVRKAWRQLQREGFEVARCTVERLMREMGLQGVIRRQADPHDSQRQGRALPARQGQSPVPRSGTE